MENQLMTFVEALEANKLAAVLVPIPSGYKKIYSAGELIQNANIGNVREVEMRSKQWHVTRKPESHRFILELDENGFIAANCAENYQKLTGRKWTCEFEEIIE